MAPPHWMHVTALSADALQQFANLQEFAFAEIDADGAVRSVNPFARLCWGWDEGVSVPEDVLFILQDLAPEASERLPLKKGGLFLHGVRLPANGGWVVVGYEEEEAVADVEGRDDFRALIDRMPAMIVRMQSDGTVRYCNAETMRRTGYSREDIVGTRFFSRIALPEHLSAVEQGIRHISGSEAGHLDFQYREKKGRVVNARMHLFFNESYEVEAVITDRGGDATGAAPFLIQESVDQSPLGLILLDETGTIRYLNNRFRELVGITTAAAWQSRVVDEAPGFDTQAAAHIRSCLRDGEAVRGAEASFSTASGQVQRALISVSPVYRDARRAGCAVLVEGQSGDTAFDDPRTRFEKAAATLREVATAAPDETVFLDSACRIIGEAATADRVRILLSDPSATAPFSCASWAAMKGFAHRNTSGDGDREVLITMGPAPELYVGPDEDVDAAAMASVIQIREAYWIRLQKAGGLDAFIALERLPGETNTNSAWGRKDRQYARRLAEVLETLWSWIEVGSRYRMVVASIDDALFGFTFAEDGRRRYLFATEQMKRIAGRAPSELTDLHASGIDWIEDVVHPDDRPMVRAHDRTLEQGHESRISYRIQLDDGTDRWVMEQAAPHPDPTGISNVSGILTDISERKAAEEKMLEAKREAEQSSRQKTGFIATLSHEIRTPLGAVNGFAQLLEREIEEYQAESGAKLPEQVQEFVRAIADRSSRLQDLVHDLFELSSIEMGKVQLQRVPVAIHGSIRTAAHKVADDLRRKGIKMRLQLDSRDPKVLGDPRRIDQVLDGIISNAVKFTEHGSISVRTQAGMREVLIEIKDSGIGIDAEYQKDLFTPFTQEDDWRTRRFEGTGLGLSLVKRLLDHQGGRIEVDSEKDVGSTFRVYLPALRGTTARGTHRTAKDRA